MPPIIVVGDPGVGYEYLENFEYLNVTDRRVVAVTFAPPAPYGAADAWAAQLRAVYAALRPERASLTPSR